MYSVFLFCPCSAPYRLVFVTGRNLNHTELSYSVDSSLATALDYRVEDGWMFLNLNFEGLEWIILCLLQNNGVVQSPLRYNVHFMWCAVRSAQATCLFIQLHSNSKSALFCRETKSADFSPRKRNERVTGTELDRFGRRRQRDVTERFPFFQLAPVVLPGSSGGNSGNQRSWRDSELCKPGELTLCTIDWLIDWLLYSLIHWWIDSLIRLVCRVVSG